MLKSPVAIENICAGKRVVSNLIREGLWEIFEMKQTYLDEVGPLAAASQLASPRVNSLKDCWGSPVAVKALAS